MTGSSNYARFIILSAARTGSNMLASALNSSPNIICFRELFNRLADFIGFDMDGYDNSSAEDRELRDRDFRRFLEERIYCRHPEEVQAVGFKMPYDHFLGFPGLREWLVEERQILVLHLKRRNLLRSFVSVRIAWTTGGWVEDRPTTLANRLTPANALRAVRHPLRAASALGRAIRPGRPRWTALRAPVALTEEECRSYFQRIGAQEFYYDELFRGHPKLEVYYEEMLQQPRATFKRVQEFLGVTPRPLSAATRRQNPEPLPKLLANYDELYEAFSDTPYKSFFD